MHTVLKSLVAVVALFALNASAVPQGEVVIRTRQGKVLMGRILTETSKGYLLAGADGTSVVEFRSIVEIRELAQTAAAEPARPVVTEPVPPMVAAPPTPAVVAEAPAKPAAAPVPAYYAVAAPKPAAPVLVANEAPPPPERPVEPSVEEVVQKSELTPKRSREGFHFGLGIGGMVLPAGPMAQAQVHFEFNFGRPVYRISVNGGYVAAAYGVYSHAMFSLDNLFQFNITNWLAVGAGVQVGLAVGSPFAFVTISPVLQPVVVKLGDRGQHQLSLTGAVTAWSNTGYMRQYDSWTRDFTYYETNYQGVLQTYVGYSYLF